MCTRRIFNCKSESEQGNPDRGSCKGQGRTRIGRREGDNDGVEDGEGGEEGPDRGLKRVLKKGLANAMKGADEKGVQERLEEGCEEGCEERTVTKHVERPKRARTTARIVGPLPSGKLGNSRPLKTSCSQKPWLV